MKRGITFVVPTSPDYIKMYAAFFEHLPGELNKDAMSLELWDMNTYTCI